MDLPAHQLTMTVLMPPRHGELVMFPAPVSRIRTSSIKIRIKVIAGGIRSRSVRHINNSPIQQLLLRKGGG